MPTRDVVKTGITGLETILSDGMPRGIEVYRRVQAPRKASRERAAAFDPTTRVTTGVPGLDPIVNGGYFLGSTTVIAGSFCVGKSVRHLQRA